MEQIEAYFAALEGHDWEGLAACLSETVVRVGPFGDRYSPRGPYVSFLADLMPSLEGYELEVERVRPVDGGALVELRETVVMNGSAVVTHEALVFTFAETGLIERIEIFIQRVPETP